MKEPTPLPVVEPGEYWDDATATFRTATDGGSWRRHCDALHLQLLDGWLASLAPARRALKTDLFDEAAGDGLSGEMGRFAESVNGVDVAGSVASDARVGRSGLLVAQADVRHLPYRDGSFELVVSNSTLDHFDERADIAVALRELHRVTAVGGTLIVSLDNLANPVIALRALLPSRMLRALGLVPYHVGPTTTRRGLLDLLEQAGYSVRATTWFLHVPRVVAVRVCGRSDRRAGRGADGLLGRLAGWERLGRWPTARWTGHYVAALAVRR
jgi:SAM-dependent methyltransferase